MGFEPGSLTRKANAQTVQPTRHLVAHKAIAIYYSSSEILLIKKWNKISVNSCADKNVLLFEFCFSICACEVSCFTYCITGGTVSQDSTVYGDWLHPGDWYTHYRSITYAVTKIAKQFGGGKYIHNEQCIAHGKDSELILTFKMTNNHLAVSFRQL